MRGMNLLAIAAVVGLSGCAGLRAKYEPLWQPDAEPLAAFCVERAGPPAPLTDARAACFAARLVAEYRARESVARNGRQASATSQVLLAAASAAANFAAPGSGFAVDAAYSLSASSALVPQVDGILGLREKADIYTDALTQTQDGEVAFMACVTQQTGGQVADDRLTACGSTLYRVAIGSAELAEKRRTGQLYAIPDLLRAAGQLPATAATPQ